MDKTISDAITLLAEHYADLCSTDEECDRSYVVPITFDKIAALLGYQYDSTGNVANGWFHPALI